MKDDKGFFLKSVREKKPRIHNITNYVTANDCANILLALGASPIMADDASEVEEITEICGGLNINLGTLNPQKLEAMILAGKKAKELRHPVVLDPVGVGASRLRKEAARRLLEEIRFSVIRGNISEIKTLATNRRMTKGLDADPEEKVTKENLAEVVDFAKDFARQIGSILVITGEIDIVANGERAFCIYNGHPMMAHVTGTGCQLSAVITAFIVANRADELEAVKTAVCAMGLCGEIAFKRMNEPDGSATYRNYMVDAMYNLRDEEVEKGAKYEMR